MFPPNNSGDWVDKWVRQCTSDYKLNTTDLNSHPDAHLKCEDVKALPDSRFFL